MKQTFKTGDQVILKSGIDYWNVNRYDLDLNGKETTIVILSWYCEDKDREYKEKFEQDLLDLVTDEIRKKIFEEKERRQIGADLIKGFYNI